MSQRILYDPKYNLATFEGPGGFTQAPMTLYAAEAVATAFGVPLSVCKPGTTIPSDAGAPA